MTATQALLLAGQSADTQQAVLNKLHQHSALLATNKKGEPFTPRKPAGDWSLYVSVSDLQDYIRNAVYRIKEAPFQLAADGKPGGPCLDCPHLTKNQETLFAELSEESLCTNRACWGENVVFHVKAVAAKGGMVTFPSYEKKPDPGSPVTPISAAKVQELWGDQKKKKCPHTVQAVSWPSGDTRLVCSDPSCEIHKTDNHGNPVDTKTKNRERTQRQIVKAAKQASRDMSDEIASNISDSPPPGFLKAITIVCCEVVGTDVAKLVHPTIKGAPKVGKSDWSTRPSAQIAKHVKAQEEFGPQQALEILGRLLLTGSQQRYSASQSKLVSPELRSAANSIGIDVKGIERKAWQAHKPKPPGRPRKKAQAAPKKKATKTVAKNPRKAQAAKKLAKKAKAAPARKARKATK